MWELDAGRLSPSQLTDFGRYYRRTVGYIAFGPVVLMFNVPKRFEKSDPPDRGVPAVQVVNPEFFA